MAEKVLSSNSVNGETFDDEYYLDKATDPSRFERTARKIEECLFTIASYILLVVVAIVCADVFMRYVFNSPFRFTIPVAELLEVYIVSLGGCYLLREEGFVTIDLFISKRKRQTRFLLVSITSFISAFFLLVIGYGSCMKTLEFLRTGATFLDSRQFPSWLYMAPITIFYFLLSIGFIRRGLRFLRARKLVIADEKAA